jgi:hypothetical protein
MSLTLVDFLERRKKSPYKPIDPRSLSNSAEVVIDGEVFGNFLPLRPATPAGWMGND